MRKSHALGLALLLVSGSIVVFSFKGCTARGPEGPINNQFFSRGPDGSIEEMIATMNQIADNLESVNDDASADLAIPKIESAGKKLDELRKQMQNNKLSEDEGKKLGEKYEGNLRDVVFRIKDTTMKAVQKAPGRIQQLGDALTYAGQLHVDLDVLEVTESIEPDGSRANQLLRDRVISGKNFTQPEVLRRLATTYYHRRGPIGIVLEKFNWFPGPANTYSADVRLPTSLVASAAGDALAGNPLPLAAFAGVWSEPSICVVRLNVGTLASYGRPFQHFHFHDKNERLKNLLLPAQGQPRPFHYLHDAQQRGCALQVLIGNVRTTLTSQCPDHFFHVLIVEPSRGSEHDVETELLTKEAMTLYFQKLTEEGILCMHVSNHRLNLAQVVADVAASHGYACRHAKDHAPDRDRQQEETRGHFSSDWVMVTRKEKYLQHLHAPPGYVRDAPFWSRLAPSGQSAWTDADFKRGK